MQLCISRNDERNWRRVRGGGGAFYGKRVGGWKGGYFVGSMPGDTSGVVSSMMDLSAAACK